MLLTSLLLLCFFPNLVLMLHIIKKSINLNFSSKKLNLTWTTLNKSLSLKYGRAYQMSLQLR